MPVRRNWKGFAVCEAWLGTTGLSIVGRPVCLLVPFVSEMGQEPSAAEGRRDRGPRERLLDTAYELFSRRGIRGVGIEEVIEHAGVAKATLYRHFASKDDLVLAFLELRHQGWTDDIQLAQTRHTDGGPEQRLLAIFDVLDERFHSKDFDAYLFFNALVEMGADHPAGQASVRHVEHIRSMVRQLADEAGLRDTDDFARSWHILMKGSVIAAAEGDPDAAEHAKAMARSLIERHRQPAS
jgi:AcrR family transcriptional regulator